MCPHFTLAGITRLRVRVLTAPCSKKHVDSSVRVMCQGWCFGKEGMLVGGLN